MQQVNGLTNLFWGWGREDDELYTRMREKNMVVQYPKNITTGYKTFKHNHDKVKRPRDQKQYKNQWNVSMYKPGMHVKEKWDTVAIFLKIYCGDSHAFPSFPSPSLLSSTHTHIAQLHASVTMRVSIIFFWRYNLFMPLLLFFKLQVCVHYDSQFLTCQCRCLEEKTGRQGSLISSTSW